MTFFPGRNRPAKLITLALLSWGFAVQAVASPVCKAIFSDKKDAVISREDIDKTIESLAALIVRAEGSRDRVDSTAINTALNSDIKKKEQALLNYVLENKIMTATELREKLRSHIVKVVTREDIENRKREKQKKESAAKIRDSVIDGSRAIFHRIEPGSLIMNKLAMDSKGNVFLENKIPIQVTLTKPFEMMATPVTQLIWKEIAILAKKHTKYSMTEAPEEYRSDYAPVTSVPYPEVVQWVEALNELSQKGVPELVALIPGYQPGDKFGLPTEAQWEFVVTKRGQSQDRFFFGNDESLLSDYAWSWNPADLARYPRAVAQKLPLEFDGLKFYDLLGNVWEFTRDTLQDDFKPVRGGIDPQFEKNGNSIVIRGGDTTSRPFEMESSYYHRLAPNIISHTVGFRLVKDVRD